MRDKWWWFQMRVYFLATFFIVVAPKAQKSSSFIHDILISNSLTCVVCFLEVKGEQKKLLNVTFSRKLLLSQIEKRTLKKRIIKQDCIMHLIIHIYESRINSILSKMRKFAITYLCCNPFGTLNSLIISRQWQWSSMHYEYRRFDM